MVKLLLKDIDTKIYTHVSQRDIGRIKKVLWILEEEKNSKKLQFEASLIVVHKRNTSQNIPIWEHKRSSSVILSYTKWRY